MKHKSICFFILFVFLSTIKISGQPAGVLKEIDSLTQAMTVLVRSGRIGDVSEFYTADAVMNGNDGYHKGKNEITDYWNSFHGKGKDWKLQITNYSGNDKYIFQNGKSHLSLKYGDNIVTYSSLFTVVWEKQSKGSYKIALDFYRPAGTSTTHEYAIEEDSVYIKSGSDTLFGILFKPKDSQNRFPAVLCLQGGGDVGLSNYFYEARYLAENGYITLICDKSGTGLSAGPGSWITQTFREKLEEYENLLNWLISLPSVDPGKVGIHGLSEGGRLALDLAIKDPDKIAFVNAVSAPLQTFKENQLFAIQNYLYQRNYKTTTIIKVLTLWNRYFDSVASSKIPDDLIKEISDFHEIYPDMYLPGNSNKLPQRPRPEDINYGNEGKLSQVKCPVFLQYGDEDRIVNVPGSVSLLPERKDIKVTVYKDTNHSMQLSGAIVNPEYLSDKIQWLKTLSLSE